MKSLFYRNIKFMFMFMFMLCMILQQPLLPSKYYRSVDLMERVFIAGQEINCTDYLDKSQSSQITAIALGSAKH